MKPELLIGSATFLNYDYIVENCEWLEDQGDCSRYATEGEESVWVCNVCQEADVDPEEHSEHHELELWN